MYKKGVHQKAEEDWLYSAVAWRAPFLYAVLNVIAGK
jgi:hypothetical protein